MNQVFFEELEIRQPDYYLGVKGDNQLDVIAQIMTKMQEPLMEYKPDLVIVPGDVNSTFAVAFAAQRLGFKVAHLESGLRSLDKTMPEEVNRILVDHMSELFFISEEDGMDNLLKEGVEFDKMHFVGNTMIDTLVHFMPKIDASTILDKIGIEPKNYAVLTFHRPNNVDDPKALKKILLSIQLLSVKIPLVFPIHPRTMKNIKAFGFEKLLPKSNLYFTEPLGYFEFMKLIKEAKMVITDSGGIQEETTFLQVPCLTVRPSTERPVTVNEGTNTLLALDTQAIMEESSSILEGYRKEGRIPDFWDGKASERIAEILKEVL
jgi:UDP-N-acetylglucosamine 2-epimerase (non-hydrolysing)